MMFVGLKSPGRASSLMCATSCQVRAKMRSSSCARTAGSRYIEAGSVKARATSSSIFIGTIQSRMDLAFVNGVVWRPGEKPATAVACSEERIAAIGSDAEIRAHINKDARVIDARVHFLMGSRSLDELDLFGVTGQADLEKRITDYVLGRADGWVVGRGWF